MIRRDNYKTNVSPVSSSCCVCLQTQIPWNVFRPCSGDLCARRQTVGKFVPLPQSLHQYHPNRCSQSDVFQITPALYTIRRENSNRCGRKGNNEGAWVIWWWGGQNFSWGKRFINSLSLAGGFLWRPPLDCEIRLNYSGRDRWPRRGGVARKWATTRVSPLLPLPTGCTWVKRVRARWCIWIYTQEIITLSQSELSGGRGCLRILGTRYWR